MRQVARTLEISLAVHGPAANEAMRLQRSEDIVAMASPVESIVARGLDRFAGNHRRVATLAMSGLARATCGMSYVGNGAWSSVYRNGAEVLKVYRDTVGMTEEGRQVYIAERQAMCDNLSEHLGSTVVAQTFSVDLHPLGGYKAVIGHQPYVPGGNLDLFQTNTLDLNQRDIAAYCERQTRGRPQLLNLAEGTFVCDDDAGLLPDLNGVDNFRLVGANETLRLIDAESIGGPGNSWGHDLILRQAETLAKFLEQA